MRIPSRLNCRRSIKWYVPNNKRPRVFTHFSIHSPANSATVLQNRNNLTHDDGLNSDAIGTYLCLVIAASDMDEIFGASVVLGALVGPPLLVNNPWCRSRYKTDFFHTPIRCKISTWRGRGFILIIFVPTPISSTWYRQQIASGTT